MCSCYIVDCVMVYTVNVMFKKSVCYMTATFFVGIQKCAPTLAVAEDVRCEYCEIRLRASMVSLWNRLLDLATMKYLMYHRKRQVAYQG